MKRSGTCGKFLARATCCKVESRLGDSRRGQQMSDNDAMPALSTGKVVNYHPRRSFVRGLICTATYYLRSWLTRYESNLLASIPVGSYYSTRAFEIVGALSTLFLPLLMSRYMILFSADCFH